MSLNIIFSLALIERLNLKKCLMIMKNGREETLSTLTLSFILTTLVTFLEFLLVGLFKCPSVSTTNLQKGQFNI